MSEIILFPFHQLLVKLRAGGFSFGVDTIQRLSSHWQLLSENETTDREAVKWQLGALICKTQEEQSQFYQIFEETYPAEIEREIADTIPIVPPPPVPRLLEKGTETEPPPTTPPDKTEEKSPTPPSIAPAVSTPSPVLPRLVFPANSLRVWNLPDLGKALMRHQEKVWSQTTEWDVPATIRKTIRSGGIPQVVFRQRKHAPRYLALIEQKNPRDHVAGFAAELVREINRRDLETEFYFYQKTPFKCWKELRDRRTHVFLEYLKSEWSDARLLLMGSAENFVDPFTGQPTNLARDIAEYWDEVALLSTASPMKWGAAEENLATLFPVAPMSAAGLESLLFQWGDTWRSTLSDWQLQHPEPMPPDLSAAVEDENSLIVNVYRYLGKDAFRWLCAAAAYPELYFELTSHLHDEAIPTQSDLSEWEQNLRWNVALRNLSRLDWFRYGYLPEAIRKNLLNRLSPADLGTVEQELRRILEWSNNAVPQGSYAEEERNRLFEWLSGHTFRVLWIDDHPEHDVEYVERWGKQFGIFFRTARSMAEALEYFEKDEVFDFIISDTGRQGEPNTAISTLQTLRARSVFAPVAYFTNRRGLNLRGVLMEAGAVEVTNSAKVMEEILRGKVEEKFNPKPATSGSEPSENQAEATYQTATNLPDTVRAHLAEGRIGEAIAALKTAMPDNSWVVNLEERWNQLRRDETLGLSSKEAAIAARRQISDDILGQWEAGEGERLEEAKRISDQMVLLQRLGYFKGKAGGRMSEEFRQAVIAFQKDQGLTADGIIGLQTREAMEKARDEIQENAEQEAPDTIMSDQVMLEKLGYYNGEINGEMNDRMRQAIIAFQTGNGLVADGIVGAKTRAAMERALEEWEKVEGGKVKQEVPEMWRNLAKSVCKIMLLPSGEAGTGFLIEGGYIITGYGVLPNIDAVRRAELYFPDPDDEFLNLVFRLDETEFISNLGIISFSRAKLKGWEPASKLSPLPVFVETLNSEEKLAIIFIPEESQGWSPKFLFDIVLSNTHSYDILFHAPKLNPDAIGAPVFNEKGEVVAIYDPNMDSDLKRGVSMKNVMWYIKANQGSRFDFWKALIERGFLDEVLAKMKAEYPDLEELEGYFEEYQKIELELQDGKLNHEEHEHLFNNIGYRLIDLINFLESRERNQGSYAA